MDQLLEWFGREHYEQDLDRVRRFWRGEGRFIISLTTSKHGYRQSFDAGAVVDLAVNNLREQAKLPGLNLPSFFADYGTISTAKYWGGAVHGREEGVNAYIDPVAQTIDQALRLKPASLEEPTLDLQRGLHAWRRVRQRLSTDKLWLRTPDMQGTLNTAGLILNQEELLMAMYSEPAKVHAFLDRVTTFLIDFAQRLRRESNGQICGNIWPYTFYPADTGVALTEDLMPLLPPDLYKEFGIPQLRRMSAELGGLHIHCCGDWGRHARLLADSGVKIHAMEFHHPDTRLEELEPLRDTTVLVPYLLGHKESEFKSLVEFYRHLIEKADQRFRFWFAFPDDAPEMVAFARQYGAMG